MDSHKLEAMKLRDDGDGSHSVELTFKDGSGIAVNVDIYYDGYTGLVFEDGKEVSREDFDE